MSNKSIASASCALIFVPLLDETKPTKVILEPTLELTIGFHEPGLDRQALGLVPTKEYASETYAGNLSTWRNVADLINRHCDNAEDKLSQVKPEDIEFSDIPPEEEPAPAPAAVLAPESNPDHQ